MKIFLLLKINACSALNLPRKKISPSASRIIKRVTTLEVYQELVERTTEGTVSSAFPVFQRSNLAIFRGEAPSRKIGVRAANQRCFMQPPRLKEILSNISYIYQLGELRTSIASSTSIFTAIFRASSYFEVKIYYLC